MAVCSATWLAITIAVFVGNHQRPTAVWEGYRDPIGWLVLLWPALGAATPGEADNERFTLGPSAC